MYYLRLIIRMLIFIILGMGVRCAFLPKLACALLKLDILQDALYVFDPTCWCVDLQSEIETEISSFFASSRDLPLLVCYPQAERTDRLGLFRAADILLDTSAKDLLA